MNSNHLPNPNIGHLFEGILESLNQKMSDALCDLKKISEGMPTLYEAANHAITGGKRMRPLICLLACDGIEGDSSKILPTAVGIEMIHAFTLVHDDIIDGDELRRGKPSIKHLWGDDLAILTGDVLFALAYKNILSNLKTDGIDRGRMTRVLELSSEACLKLAQGQVMDISVPIDNSWKDDVIKLKTAPLFSLASTSGAILGNGSEEDVKCMEKFGLYLGMAFQIKDDVLNISGNADRVGKPWGGDLKKGKFTLPVAHALSGVEKEDVEKIFSSPERESVLMRMIKNRGSIEYSEKIARRLIESAKQNLRAIKRKDERSALEFIADHAVKRGE